MSARKPSISGLLVFSAAIGLGMSVSLNLILVHTIWPARVGTEALEGVGRDLGWLAPLMALSIMSLGVTLGLACLCHLRGKDMARRIVVAGETLARSERMRIRFLEVVSHDLRQPLQTIELFSAGLERRQTDAESRPMLQGIRFSLATMRRMLSGLLDISRLDSHAVAARLGDVAMMDILAPIAAEFAPLAQARGLSFEVADDTAIVRTDRVMLDCVLRNIISNAVRYTLAGAVRVNCHASDGDLAIMVSDTGPGIAESELGRIFQEFYRVSSTAASSEGIGLGLAIVRRMVNLLDVSLEVSSTVGAGTRFTLTVPLARGGARNVVAEAQHDEGISASEPGKQAALALAGARVLVVDDDDAIRTGLGRELAARGMEVTAVESCSAARALFASDTPRQFDIALVDRDLGSGLTGPELLDHLAADLGVAIPALVLSGTADFRVIAQLHDGDYPWLAKPVDIDVLLREMGRLSTPQTVITPPV